MGEKKDHKDGRVLSVSGNVYHKGHKEHKEHKG